MTIKCNIAIPAKIAHLPQISPEEITVIFIAEYYDIPLLGLAIYRGETVRFRAEPPQELFTSNMYYCIERLSAAELTCELSEKTEFERCVGTHWSFDPETGQPLPPSTTATPKLAQAYFNARQQRSLLCEFAPSEAIAWCLQLR